MTTDPLLSIRNLGVSFRTPGGSVAAVHDVSFDVAPGETVALVGESGSGKSVSALSVLQLLPYPTAQHTAGSSIRFEGVEMVGADASTLQGVRGRRVGMVFQEPLTSLNPLHTIERQIAEVLIWHLGMTKTAARERVLELLDLVGLSALKARLGAYPHELSGGQRQRVMIAMALACNPTLLIADEPTTALDVTVQAQVLDLLKSLQKRLGMALLLITHDLAIVRKMADRVCVMKGGTIVEQETAEALFSAPQHPYTKDLLAAEPKGTPPALADSAPLVLEARDLSVRFPVQRSFFGKTTRFVTAVNDVSFQVRAGETLGIVGESGSGKTTLGLAALRLLSSQGDILFDGESIAGMGSVALRPLRAKMQIVFQDPFGSLSPRMSVGDIIGEGLTVHRRDLSAQDREEMVVQALRDVRLDPETRHRYPHEFSGGQRQRISIARALVLRPRLMVLDEPTSALDVSIQMQVVDLLRELQVKYGIAYLFISHDLRVVRALAHRVLVMKEGQVLESGPAAQLFDSPQHPYTRALLAAALNLESREAA